MKNKKNYIRQIVCDCIEYYRECYKSNIKPSHKPIQILSYYLDEKYDIEIDIDDIHFALTMHFLGESFGLNSPKAIENKKLLRRLQDKIWYSTEEGILNAFTKWKNFEY